MTRMATLTKVRLGGRATTNAGPPGNVRETSGSYPGTVLLALLVLCLLLFVVLPFVGATIWALLTTLLVGLVLGAFARAIAPGGGPMGCLTTSLVGVLGGLLGTIASRALDTGSFARLLLQIAAAVALVMIVRPTRGVHQ